MDREKIFPNAINKYFNFLLDSGFTVFDKVEYEAGTFGNGYYIFKSETVGLEIVLDRGQVLMAIGKTSHDRRDWQEWSQFLKGYAPDIKAYDFDIDIESQVKRISKLLQQYCIELVEGNFSAES